MLQKLRAKPFLILVPGAVLLLVLLVVVQRSGAPIALRSPPPPDLEGLEDLVQPAISEQEMVHQAGAFAANMGYDPDQFLHSLWPRLNRVALTFLQTGFPAEEIAVFVDRGAPLMTWSVTLYEPQGMIGRSPPHEIPTSLSFPGPVRALNSSPGIVARCGFAMQSIYWAARPVFAIVATP